MSDNLSIEYVTATSITPHPENPRRGDVAAIRESMDTSGVYRPVIVQRSTGHILAGNHSYLAMRENGLTDIPVVYRDVDDVQARRIMLADNRTADLGGYDDEGLAALLDDMPTLEGTGYDDASLADLVKRIEVPDFLPDDDDDNYARLDHGTVTDCPKCGHTFAPTIRDQTSADRLDS